jgi:hypothetical protein
MDVTSNNMLSLWEFANGLTKLGILEEKETLKLTWKMFDRDPSNQITYVEFFAAFRRAGAIKIIDFEDEVTRVIKKFTKLLDKIGNYEILWEKFDKHKKGAINFLQFADAADKLQLGLTYEEMNIIFSELMRIDSDKTVKVKDQSKINLHQSPERMFSYR